MHVQIFLIPKTIFFFSCQANFYQEKFAQLIEAEVDRRLEAESELRVERERQVDFVMLDPIDCFSTWYDLFTFALLSLFENK